MSNQNQRGHILDGAYVPRCANCLQRGSQCIDHSIPRRWGQPVDHCNYYTSQRHDLFVGEFEAWYGELKEREDQTA